MKKDKRIHAFPMGISPKVNVMVWVNFALVYYDVSIQHVYYYSMVISLDHMSTICKW